MRWDAMGWDGMGGEEGWDGTYVRAAAGRGSRNAADVTIMSSPQYLRGEERR